MISGFIFAAVLLLIGVVLRLRFAVFQRLFIPASVIAGMVGLICIQGSTSLSWQPLDEIANGWSETLRSWPGFLIAVIFSGMLLERKPAPWKESVSRVGRQGLMVWVIVLGETAAGLLATWLLIRPFFEVPNSIGMLIETGFAGGHGTAAAMGQVYRQPSIDLASGLDLGVLMATCGLVYGLVSGIGWINLAVRFGWIAKPAGMNVANSIGPPATDEASLAPIGYARVRNETLDPLLLQIVWLTLAFGIGLALQSLVTTFVGSLEAWMQDPVIEGAIRGDELYADRLTLKNVAESFPLFIYTLFGGLIVRRLLTKFGYEHAIDRETINRLTATAMDILVVAAVATLNLAAVATLIVPFLTLFLFGIVWTGFCLLVLARWILPRQHWFQLGLINYGMSTGTTATGFVLLRLVDPELESGATEDYALAAPLSSPFIGGGMVTIALPLLVLERLPLPAVTLGLWALVVTLILLGTPLEPDGRVIPARHFLASVWVGPLPSSCSRRAFRTGVVQCGHPTLIDDAPKNEGGNRTEEWACHAPKENSAMITTSWLNGCGILLSLTLVHCLDNRSTAQDSGVAEVKEQSTAPALKLGPALRGKRVIDLSHTFDKKTIYWPTEDGFRLVAEKAGFTEKGYYYSSNRFIAAEHGGTHLDAPVHFYKEGKSADELPLSRLMGEAAVIDVTDACRKDPDYQIGVDDLRRWEESEGRQLIDVIVLLNTGYAKYWSDRKKYLGTDELGPDAVAKLHFPGLAPEAAQWLCEHRSIKAVGLDTASIDYGQSERFQSHVTLFKHGIPAFENVGDMSELPAAGSTVIALPMKIGGGSGAPVRIIAILPEQ